ncbi:pyridoxamine 5'-phosphate oxidase [Arcticibacterium luteifluviistationis]|uniref:Pyridoxine/pyridoxamine 5'-phosphate oxidase n=1 Tax=Arcticibacterium luteifluviistationis TaxID=1784714 RepID=A0A2Z4GAP5_9BACT|nr:pyridoxamine 5'-phosphate oxidase [Arcticibacterium luteifluviistationis]AWV98214.1 pyridoxamine 5'-phosphate oxidase [Arcticibacterium luteifluviistationis]
MVGKSTKENNLSGLRVNYDRGELLEQNIGSEPISLFSEWMEAAKSGEIKEPNAMVLSTIRDEKPTARVVLLKGFDEKGFIFFTNYQSHKGIQLEKNPNGAITFFWDALQRQVRIEGIIEKVSEEESDEYYHSRPKASQIGAWVSKQSTVIENRDILEEKNTHFEEKYKDVTPIPRPPHWGGYILKPTSIEFWQGRQSRLHDRILFSKQENSWQSERLSP